MNVLITGSTRGLGRELALRFARAGNGIIVHGRDLDLLDTVAAEIRSVGASCVPVCGELRDDGTIMRLEWAARIAHLDVLINNAGIYQSDGSFSETVEIIGTNLIAPILLTNRIYPIMAERGSGLIVNINSLAGKFPNDKESVYCASKHGLRGYMDSFKFAARKTGVSVLDVYAGAMATYMTKGRVVQGTLIDPAEAADAIYKISVDPYLTMVINEIGIGRKG